MPTTPQVPVDGAAAADWLTGRLNWRDPWVRGHVGAGFERYGRLLHPLGDEPDRLTWSDVAKANGRVLHPSAQWDQISSPGPYRPDGERGRGYPGEPIIGDLFEPALTALCDVLERHTGSGLTCYFAVWEGWNLATTSGTALFSSAAAGQPPAPITYAPADWQLDMSGPTFDLPYRKYHLFQGGLRDALRIGEWSTTTAFHTQSPNLFWPADHSWCVATEVDFDSTLIGGSSALINDLVSSPELEVLAIDADAPYDDEVNL